MKQALGIVETKGLVTAIMVSDLMLKTAQVQLYSKEKIGSGLVTVTIVGDVAAVKSSVTAATNWLERETNNLLVAAHVIPRPDQTIEALIAPMVRQKNELQITTELVANQAISAEPTGRIKEEVFTSVEQKNPQSKHALKRLRISELRILSKKQVDFSLSHEAIDQASKKILIEELSRYFKQFEL